MSRYVVFALLCAACSAALAATPCENLRARIEAQIRANGTADHELEIVDPEMVLKRKIVGTCRNENKKIIYKRGHYEDLILSYTTKEPLPDSGDDPDKKKSIREVEQPMVILAGHAGDFDCDDPAYATVDKVVTFHMVFMDGGAKDLCRKAGTKPALVPSQDAHVSGVGDPAVAQHYVKPLP